MTIELTTVRSRAGSDADKAARKAQVAVRELRTRAECVSAEALMAQIWGTPPDSPPLSGELLRALSHAGGCLMGAYDAGAIVGVVAALAGPPASDRMYSVIAGVTANHAGRGVGMALKQAQRLWALERGATRMVWTFDPLVRRNAHFNLNRLGARVTEFTADFYPPMRDALNRADHTDRLTVVWDLVNPEPCDGHGEPGLRILDHDQDGQPVTVAPQGEPVLLAWIPRDIENLRRTNPALAMRWRLASRTALGDAGGAAYRPNRVTSDGYYVLTKQEGHA